MAANGVTIEMTCADGRPVAALESLIAERTRILGETTRDAVIATAITALKSIRAATRKNKGGIKPVTTELGGKLSVAVSELPNFRMSWNGRRAVVRERDGKTIHPEIKPWLHVPPSQIRNAKVFQISLSADRVEAWPRQKLVSYVAATDLKEATRIVTQRFDKVAKSSSSLARDALSRAMGLVSSRPTKLTSSDKAQRVLNRPGLVAVVKDEKGFASGSVSIVIEDNLRYAADALNGGAAYVPTALARAANAVNGMINNYIGTHPFLDAKKFERPFPESAFDPESGMLI